MTVPEASGRSPASVEGLEGAVGAVVSDAGDVGGRLSGSGPTTTMRRPVPQQVSQATGAA